METKFPNVPFLEDLRDLSMAQYLETINKKNLTYKVWKLGPLLEQTEASCVGCACKLIVESEPKARPAKSEKEIFELARKIENNPKKEGTGIRSGLKALQQLGYISNYYWADNITEIALGVIHIGPLIVGVHFYFSDLETKKEYLTAMNGIAGEHAFVVYGVNFKKQYFLVANSFGPEWGDFGRIKVDFQTMKKIFIYGAAPIKI